MYICMYMHTNKQPQHNAFNIIIFRVYSLTPVIGNVQEKSSLTYKKILMQPIELTFLILLKYLYI